MSPNPAEGTLDLLAGRRAFGDDAQNYDSARPDYPARVFALLRERCGLGQGTRTFEIGPGTGLATRPLLATGATVTAIEPDERLASVLRQRAGKGTLDIVAEPFESVVLPAAAFDLGCCATAFHWLDQRPALAKIATLLRPGGWWAMWWNVFGDAGVPDAFHDATQGLLGGLQKTPSQPVSWRHPFALDREARVADLMSVERFAEVDYEELRWKLVLDAAQVRALYATFSHIAVLAEADRERILDGLRDIAQREFSGRVERNMITAIYTAQRR